MTKSKKNLAMAFSGELIGNKTLLAFAEGADKDGFPQIAKLFRIVAVGEFIHASNFLQAMGGGKILKGNLNVSPADVIVKSINKNLKTASMGEKTAYAKIYPSFIETAKVEGNKIAEETFQMTLEVEAKHYRMLEAALSSVKDGKDLPDMEIYLCPICGYPSEKNPPEKCPICSALKDKFIEFV